MERKLGNNIRMLLEEYKGQLTRSLAKSVSASTEKDLYTDKIEYTYKKCDYEYSDATEKCYMFPGDKCPKEPDYIVCGAGTTALPFAKSLTDKGYRVLVIEAGLDQSNNDQVKYVFDNSLYQVNDPAVSPGALNNNIINITMDPNVTSYMGNSGNPGDGFSLNPAWTGRGVGGGGIHYYGVMVKPIPEVLDGLLNPGLNVPNSVPYKVSAGAGTYTLSDAGGDNWNSSVILPLCKSIETYNCLCPTPNPTGQRGESGPLAITRLFEDPTLLNAMQSAARNLQGGDPTTQSVPDYNVLAPDTINCVAADQFAFQLTPDFNFIRQNSATAWANSGIVDTDKDGNLVGKNGRRLLILTNRQVVRAVKNTKKSKKSKYVAAGVEFMYNNQIYFVRGKRVVSAMGGAYSPLFWQRSGIGPQELLEKVKIPMEINSPFIGRNLSNQYGTGVTLSTTSLYWNTGFWGQAFVKYNGVNRRVNALQATSVLNTIGLLKENPFPATITKSVDLCPEETEVARYSFQILLFDLHPRSRGYSQLTQANIGVQTDFQWGTYNDGQGVNPTVKSEVYEAGGNPDGYKSYKDPSAGLFDQNGCFNPDYDSDIAVQCAMLDWTYEVVYNDTDGLRVNNPADDIRIEYPPLDLFTIPDKSVRWQKYVPYITNATIQEAHEAGTVMMHNDPTKGACDGNLRLHGTTNCFEVSAAVLPVQNSGNPANLLMAMGLNAANIIPNVPLC
jgi:choline dehydrogenase-like flavoprotein